MPENSELAQIKKAVQAANLMIESAESNLKKARWILNNINNLGSAMGDLEAIANDIKEFEKTPRTNHESDDGQVIYGNFDGYFMLGEDLKKYPVPLNYSSKSKLVPGDKLKLTITENGQLMYKLILPCERKHKKAVLSRDEEDTTKFIAITAEGENFVLNQAAVTFFKGRPGDEIYIITNKEGSGRYAAIEAVIKN